MLLFTRAPAKVNLVLRVGPRRDDGYHDIDSLMVPLGLYDDVEVRVSMGRRGPISCRCPGRADLDGPSNLAVRAAEAFRARFGVGDRCAIQIRKRIPVTAGLGGGSSDAAAVIACLARAYRIHDRSALVEIGASVGSDVPFFLGDGPAWASGRGERLTPSKVPALNLVLVYPRDPALAIRAADAYRWLDASRSGSEVGPWKPVRGRYRSSLLGNDLESSCIARHPELNKLILLLEANGASRSIVSGSGPTVFGLFSDRNAARRGAQALGGRADNAALDVYVVRTLQHRPGVEIWKSPRSASSPSTKRS